MYFFFNFSGWYIWHRRRNITDFTGNQYLYILLYTVATQDEIVSWWKSNGSLKKKNFKTTVLIIHFPFFLPSFFRGEEQKGSVVAHLVIQ
jgi:hypothetical protein